MTILYPESLNQSLIYGKRAFEDMEKYRIPTTPHNFTVWYVYHLGSNQQLNQLMNHYLNTQMQFKEEINEEIYNKFFENTLLETQKTNETIYETTNEASLVLENIKKHLEESLTHVSESNQSIQGIMEQLKQTNSLDQFKHIIETIVLSTQRINQENNLLKEKMNQSQSKIVELKTNLDVVRQQSYTDPLTNVANRKLFDLTLKKAIEEAHQTKNALCLMMVDIDYFKKFNDNYGHVLGDQVLKLVAQTMEKNIKHNSNYLVARYGGEEFSVVLPQTSLQSAVILANNMRLAIASKNIQSRKTGEVYGKVTISIGVAEYNSGETPTDLIQRADKALYAAKKGGRNQVSTLASHAA
jgi:diguanylate cyclase